MRPVPIVGFSETRMWSGWGGVGLVLMASCWWHRDGIIFGNKYTVTVSLNPQSTYVFRASYIPCKTAMFLTVCPPPKMAQECSCRGRSRNIQAPPNADHPVPPAPEKRRHVIQNHSRQNQKQQGKTQTERKQPGPSAQTPPLRHQASAPPAAARYAP